MAQRKVRVLPDEIANRIAAGEVVERPASVVKELVENSVDAGASRVRVRLEGAGKRLVAVEDDGEGMAREDALLALERHATSKISSAGDLDGIVTLGFRGEALPSIASVSRVRIVTRTGESPEGTEIRVEGGRIASVRAVGTPRGTAVEVADIFFNVPARRKFLKGDATELRHCAEVLTQLALVHHDVGFDVRSGGRLLMAVPPGQSLEDRTEQIVGPEAPGGLHWACWDEGERSLQLAYGAPHEGRGHRKGVRFFVNGRPVQDRLLLRALLEGHKGLLERGRYPVALLWLVMPPAEVDVNVHPAKREVRFRDEGRVFRWVAGCVAEALSRAPWLRGAPPPAGKAGAEPQAERRPELTRVAEAVEGYARKALRAPLGGRWGGQGPRRPARPGAALRAPTAAGELPLQMPPRPGAAPGPFQGFRFLACVDATYLLFVDPGGTEVVVIDQHAAHERILYERLLGSAGRPASQGLLIPVTFECTAAERAAYEERREAIGSLGFRVEPFGASALAVTEAPGGLDPGAVERAVRDLLGAAAADDVALEGEARREALARRAACAAAVKARQALDPSEAEELLRRLGGLRNPSHCPHGRPLVVRLDRRGLEALFHRR